MKNKTTRIKMLSMIAGDHFAYDVGQVVDFDREDAKRLIAAGYAVLATQKESASIAPPENAMQHGAEPRVRSAV